jgi:hypothetical protein
MHSNFADSSLAKTPNANVMFDVGKELLVSVSGMVTPVESLPAGASRVAQRISVKLTPLP